MQGSSKKRKKDPQTKPQLQQSKIVDYVQVQDDKDGGADKVTVSFDGRMESFSEPELQILSSFLLAKSSFSKAQLALAVEVWNSNPTPDAYQFLPGEREGRAVALASISPGIEHLMFRERGQQKAATPASLAGIMGSQQTPQQQSQQSQQQQQQQSQQSQQAQSQQNQQHQVAAPPPAPSVQHQEKRPIGRPRKHAIV